MALEQHRASVMLGATLPDRRHGSALAPGKVLCMAQLPTQSQFGDYGEWPGRDVLDSGGERLGGVREIYLDRETGRPEWVLVDVDGDEARFVPLADADVESRRSASPTPRRRSAARPASAPSRASTSPRSAASTPTTASATPRTTRAASLPDRLERCATTARRGRPAAARPATARRRATRPRPRRARTGARDARRRRRSAHRRADPTPSRRRPRRPAPLTPPWRTEAEPTNDAPPPAEPPSPAEIEAAQIPEEPPASSDRGTEYETAPFGAVAPPPDERRRDRRTDVAPTPLHADDVDAPALTPHAAAPELDPPALAAPIDGPSTLTPPSIATAPIRPPRRR